MFKLRPLLVSTFACIATASPALAQEAQDSSARWSWEQPESDAPKTWYALIAIRQAVGPQGCDVYRYKVSTREPIKLVGPPEIRPNHGNELTAWWMMHLRKTSPTAYRWLTTSVGHEPAQVYFRETPEEVLKAFRADGHLRRDRSCSGSVLVTMRTSNFSFDPSEEFTRVDFGHEPAPQNVTVSRDLRPAPGAR
ncbi:MAG: hypothetical protein AAFY42_09440 [Pseudomonadota bacterium]